MQVKDGFYLIFEKKRLSIAIIAILRMKWQVLYQMRLKKLNPNMLKLFSKNLPNKSNSLKDKLEKSKRELNTSFFSYHLCFVFVKLK